MTVGADASGNHQEPEGNWDGIICFANDWYADPLSKKHIMLRFARSRRILWINSVNNRRPRMAGKDFRRVFQKLTEFRRGTGAGTRRDLGPNPALYTFPRQSHDS